MRQSRVHRTAAAIVLLMLAAAPAVAQSSEPAIRLRGYADFGALTFTSTKSFKAVLGKDNGPVFGGGIEIVQKPGWFLQVRASRFKKTGQRVFLFSDQLFSLGIPVDVEVQPLDITGGFRLERWPVIPYGGIGYTSVRYKETSKYAEASEDLDKRYGGFLVLGGGEVRLWRWLGVAGEVSWSRVTNAIGTDGISKEYGETDLGGTTGRVKIVIGR